MNFVSVICAVVLLSCPIFAETASGESKKLIKYDSLVQLVAEKNEEISASRLQMQSEQSRTGRLTRSFLPQLHLEGGYEQMKKEHLTDTPSREYWKLSASMNLLNGGRDMYEAKARNAKAGLAEISFKSDLQRNIFEAKQKYLNVLFLKKQIAMTTEALEKNEVNLRASKRRASVGTAAGGDTYQFELKKVELQRKLTELELEYDAEKNKLSVLIGEDNHKDISVEDNFPSTNSQQPGDRESKIHSETPTSSFADSLAVKTQNELARIEQYASSGASNWWLPKVDLYAVYELPTLSEDYNEALNREKEQFAGIKLSFELEDIFEKSSEAKAQSLNAKAAKAKSDYVARQTKAAIHEIEHDIYVVNKLLSTADQDIKLAEKFLKTTTDEYNRGVKNGPDLIGALDNYYQFVLKKNEYLLRYFVLNNELQSFYE